jgi:hypothetical protein
MMAGVRFVSLAWGSTMKSTNLLTLLVLLIPATKVFEQAGFANEVGPKDKKVKVFLLVGQSNMEGKGDPLHLETYKDDPLIKPTYAGLKDGRQWKIRSDVFISYPTKSKGAKHGPLTVGYGTKGENSIGPEFGFGHTVGNLSKDPVLLIKIAWGGKSVAVDFRPPGAPPTTEEINRSWEKAKKKKPNTTVAQAQAKYGHYYRETIRLAKQELADFEQKFPKLQGHTPVLAGFVWHQGFNDKINRTLREKQYVQYTKWLVQLIRDVRNDLGVPNLPFVIGELSTGGIPNRGDFQIAQANVVKGKSFAGSVAFVKTAEFYDTRAHELFEKNYWKGTESQKAEWRKVGNDRPYHYLGSGKTYYLKGVAFGEQIMKMQSGQ